MHDPWGQAVGPDRGGAFSLIEMVMVLVIMGALASIAIPRYANSLTRYRVDAAAERVVADIAYARQLARSSNASKTVHFMISSHKVHLLAVPDMDKPGIDYVTDLSEAPYRTRILSADFGGDTKVVFDIYGVPDSGGQVVIESGDWQKTVAVDAENGTVTVQ